MKKKLKLFLVSVQYMEDDEFEIEAYNKKEARKKAEQATYAPYVTMDIEEMKEE